MRENMGLYRGKAKNDGEWLCGHYTEYAGVGQIWVATDNGKHNYIVDIDTVGEYTGLNDKNGKRIFEGDIVVDKDTGNIRTVEYHGCRFVFVSLFRHFAHVFYEEDWEIIGNVHDNPELLEGTQK